MIPCHPSVLIKNVIIVIMISFTSGNSETLTRGLHETFLETAGADPGFPVWRAPISDENECENERIRSSSYGGIRQ